MRSTCIWRSRNKARRAGWRAAALLLAPSLLGTAVFYLLPFLEVIRRSFTDAAGRRFLGLANYQTVLSNRAFHTAAANTARFLCVCIPALLAVSLVMALLARPACPARCPPRWMQAAVPCPPRWPGRSSAARTRWG